MCVPDGVAVAPCGLVVLVVLVVVCCMGARVGWWFGCWCGGVNVCVLPGWGAAPWCVLVCWWFGGWWCVVLCVGVGGVLLGYYTLVFCVLVSWRGGAHVCVFLRGCCPIVGWWCWCVGGVLPGALHSCGVVCWWCGVLVPMYVYS